ncbi:MAG: hypothetical protein RIR69_188 [Actinomycetota bacterium]
MSLIAVSEVLATTPGVMVCAKSADLTYVLVNQAFADRTFMDSPGDVIGKRAHDVFPAELVDTYEAQDRLVLTTGRMLTNELEAVTGKNGEIGWHLTSKSRWTNPSGEIGGLVSITVDLRTPFSAAAPHASLLLAVNEARLRFRENITVADMASKAELSIPQLERLANRVLGLSPKQLVMRFRLEEALKLLDTSSMSLGEIALACGYYDQSSFTRHFKRVVGWSPSGWRTMVRNR